MAANFNQVTLAGTIGKMDSFTTATGLTIVTVSLAVTKFKKTDDGFEDSTDWFTVKLFGQAAERVATNNTVGDNVLLTGELATNKYEKDGVTHYQTSINTNKLHVCKYGKNNPKGNQTYNGTSTAPAQASPAADFNMKYANGNPTQPVEGWDDAF